MTKQLVALSGAAMFGIWLGITYAGNIAYPEGVGMQPGWVNPLQGMQLLTIVAAGICVAGWIFLDHREQTHDTQ
jgi:branched-subunit amino acid permease